MNATKKYRSTEEEAEALWREVNKLFPEEADLVMVEELARELAKSAPRPREITTKIVDLKNRVVRQSLEIVKENRPGHIKEITIRSPSKDFSIFIVVDNAIKLYRSYDELVTLSPSSETVSAYREAGTDVYVLHVKDLHWTENVLVEVYVTRPVTFNNVWAVFDVQT